MDNYSEQSFPEANRHSPRAFFNAYVQDRRHQEIESFTREDLGSCVRYTPAAGAEGFVLFTRIAEQDIEQLIDEQISYFKARKEGFEWKVHEFNEPDKLLERLLARGFTAEAPEAFMACTIGKMPDHTAASTVCQLVRVTDAREIDAMVAVQEQVWKRDFGWLTEQLLTSLSRHPDRISLYCAYVEGVPVGTGWTDFPGNSKFPELHGGAVLPEFRGRGIYKALYSARLNEAAQRGYDTVVVDASPMSRPILEKLGFRNICLTCPMRLES